MRNLLALLAASTMLAACGGGGGPTYAGGTPPPSAGGSGSGSGGTHTFENPNETRTYQGIGGAHTLSFLEAIQLGGGGVPDFAGDSSGQTAITYAGEASTARNSQIQITFDPRAGVYTLRIDDPLSNTSVNTRFQDPASLTDFGGAAEPQWGAPDLQFSSVTYYEAGDGDPLSPYEASGNGTIVVPGTNDVPPLMEPESTYQSATFFLQTPGTSTQYVTFAGFVRNSYTYAINEQTGAYEINHTLSRGAFAFGERTPNDDVPTTGVFDLSGNMLATMINNPTIDGEMGPVNDSYFQWIQGTVDLTVDFANDEVRDIAFSGTVTEPQIQALTQYSASFDPNGVHSYVPAGTLFEATGSAEINLVNVGGFLGSIDTARFVAQAGNLFADGASVQDIAITGSSIDGAFFGPDGEEVGGGFRVVGGVPDQRVDILGTFTAGN